MAFLVSVDSSLLLLKKVSTAFDVALFARLMLLYTLMNTWLSGDG
jgi:hypothetical protein